MTKASILLVLFLCALPTLSLAQAPSPAPLGLGDLARARALLEQGDALEGALLLRRLVSEPESAPGLQDLARFYLGQQDMLREDFAGALRWFEAIARPLADRMLGLDLLFGRARCLLALERNEEIVPTLARELSTLRRAFPEATPEAQIAFRVLKLALRAGREDWVPGVLGRSLDEVLHEQLSSASPEALGELAALPGLPASVAEPLMAYLGGPERLQSLIELAQTKTRPSEQGGASSDPRPWRPSSARSPVSSLPPGPPSSFRFP